MTQPSDSKKKHMFQVSGKRSNVDFKFLGVGQKVISIIVSISCLNHVVNSDSRK